MNLPARTRELTSAGNELVPDTKQPNFVLIITDQHRADHLGCCGNPVVQTPNIDGLAAAGVAFDKFYVATPVCMPNRASLVTGRCRRPPARATMAFPCRSTA